MLLCGSLPAACPAGNGEKVLGGGTRRRPCNAWKETIANAAHGFQENRLGGIVFNVTAQPDHEVVDGPCVRVLVHPPDLFQ